MPSPSKKTGLRTPPIAEYMKIRQYVVSLAQRSGDGPTMLPPMTELAERFGVTRMTVHKALKDLIEDRFLVSRRGIGTFVNPSRLSRRRVQAGRHCIGIVVGDGKHCFYGQFYWSLIAAVGQAITSRGHRLKILGLSASSPKGMVREVRDSFVDAVAWIDCHSTPAAAALRLLKSKGFPTLAVHSNVEGVSHVGMNGEAHALEVGRSLLNEGRRNIVFAVADDSPFLSSELAGFRQAFEEAGVTFKERLVLRDFLHVQEDMEEILEFGIDVQGLFVVNSYLPEILAALQKHNVDIRDHCRVVAEPFYLDQTPGFHGWVREYRFPALGGLAVDLLERQLAGNMTVDTHLLDFTLKTVMEGF